MVTLFRNIQILGRWRVVWSWRPYLLKMRLLELKTLPGRRRGYLSWRSYLAEYEVTGAAGDLTWQKMRWLELLETLPDRRWGDRSWRSYLAGDWSCWKPNLAEYEVTEAAGDLTWHKMRWLELEILPGRRWGDWSCWRPNLTEDEVTGASGDLTWQNMRWLKLPKTLPGRGWGA